MSSLNTPLSWLESAALAVDRTASLKELTPDSNEYFFFNVVHLQQERKLADASQWLERYRQRFPYSQEFKTAETRQKLLLYDDPKTSASAKAEIVQWVIEALRLTFTHAKEVSRNEVVESHFPSAVNADELADETLLKKAFDRDGVRGLTQHPMAIEWLANSGKVKLDENQLEQLLDMVPDAWLENLPAHVSEHLKKRGFGSIWTHSRLTLAQLDALLKKDSSLANNENFVKQRIDRLMPFDLEDDEPQSLSTEAQSTRLAAVCNYAVSLPPSFNSIKIAVLYHRLNIERSGGVLDQEKFWQYVQIPKAVHYANPTWLSNERKHPENVAYLGNFSSNAIPSVSNDEPLVRDFLMAYFKNPAVKSVDKFAPYVSQDYLKRVFAEAKLLHTDRASDEDVGKWIAMLEDPSFASSLKERVDVEFAMTNKRVYPVSDAVSLDVYVKNVKNLVVKIFEINTRAYYRAEGQAIPDDINLDGLTAHTEFEIPCAASSSFVRTLKSIPLPSLANRRGVFVVELLGNGSTARAVIRKGHLRFFDRKTLAGHIFRVYDEKGAQVPAASIWLSGQNYTADANGEIVVPYNPSSSTHQTIVISAGDFSDLGSFLHHSENYSLRAGFYVDRESLTRTRRADVVIRPDFTLNDLPTSFKLLENVALTITTTDEGQVESAQTVTAPELVLDSSQETVYTFTVPENVRKVSFELRASVKRAVDGSTQQLSASQSYDVNSIEDTNQIDELHLRWAGNGYSVFLLGKAGEARASVPLQLTFQHSFVNSTTDISCQTDQTGKVFLGHLPNIVGVTARVLSSGWSRNWNLSNTRRVVYSTQLTARKGQSLVLPYVGQQKKVTAKYFCILRKSSSGTNLSDHTSALSIQNGLLVIAPLEPGTYHFFHKELNETFAILVVDGPLISGKYVMTPTRFLELSQPAGDKPWSPLHIIDATVAEEKGAKDSNVVVQLSGVSADSRVHIIASHFYPEWDLYEKFAQHTRPPLNQSSHSVTAESTYLSQKALSLEQRYILDRKGAKKYVGNMLERPSLLLNPRVHDTTSFDDASAIAARDAEEERRMGGGGIMREKALKKMAAPMASAAFVGGAYGAKRRGGSSATRNLEFLAGPASVHWNLRASANGTVSVAMSQLQLKRKAAADQVVPPHTHVLVVATDSLGTAVFRLGLGQLAPAVTTPITVADHSVAFADPAAYADTRLLQSLDGTKHLLEQHIISLLLPGQPPLLINDVKSATVVAYETLQDAFALYSTVFGSNNDGPLLKKFDFLPRWQSLSENDKKAKYSEFSCNELNYFLFKKDPQFFQTVVHNFVAQKPKFSRTFLDNWFLFPANDPIFATYAAPRQFKRLNFFEKILLAEKLGANGLKNIGRLGADLDEAHPKDREAFVKRFKTAVQTKYMASPPPPEPELEAGMEEDERKEQSDYDDDGAECEMADDEADGAVFAAASAPSMAFMAMECAPPPPPPGAPMPKGAAPRSRMMAMADSSADFADFDGLMQKREAVRQMFREPESTKEYEENGYYLFGCNADTSGLVHFTPFWGDFAAHVAAGKQTPFLSQHFGDVGRTFSAYVLALAVLDLPFKPLAPSVTEDGFNMQYQANAPSILFNKQVRDGDIVPSSVAVSQNYYDPQDAFTETKEDGRVDKYIENEFLMNKEYCCRVVLTNVSSNLQKVEVLMQIPQGAMPVGHDNTTEGRGFRTRTVFIEIPAYSTKMLEYSFYFPALGQYKHYPVHASRNGRIIGFGQPRVLKVVNKSTAQPDLTSWKHVSQNGTNEQVLHFLEQQNVHKISSELVKMAWRFKKQDSDTKAFYLHVLERLRARHVFDSTIWSYSLYHQDVAAIKEYLPVSAFSDRVGPYFSSGLLSVDAYTSGKYNHYEYAPLINQRAHVLQARTSGNVKQLVILNNQLEKQYREFLALMMYRFSGRNEIDRAHLMVAIYYLLLQDRIDSARELFVVLSSRKHDLAAVVQEGVQMQYDYLRAYMDFSSASLDKGPVLAREIAASYKQYPVNKKRKLFEEIEKQAEEIFGSIAAEKKVPAAAEHKPEVPEPSARDREMAALASSEPSLDFAIEDKQLVIHYQNVKSVVLNVFYMDIELLFSTNAFIDGHSGNEKFTYVAPNRSLTIDNLRGASQAAAGTYTAPLPDFLNNRNAYVEVVAPGTGVSRSVPFYSHSLNLQLMENYGQLKVANRTTGAAIPQAYVKVFSRSKSGDVEFFKDGYTDMRGRFDYASVSSKKLESLDKFSILVLTESHGAVVRQASPPAH